MKPTIVLLCFASLLLGGLAFRKPLLKPLLGSAWPLYEAGWHKLTLRFALFFLAMAALNEAVWRTQSTDFWVTFKVFGILGLTFVFVASQVFFMRTHMLPDDDEAAGKPRDRRPSPTTGAAPAPAAPAAHREGEDGVT